MDINPNSFSFSRAKVIKKDFDNFKMLAGNKLKISFSASSQIGMTFNRSKR